MVAFNRLLTTVAIASVAVLVGCSAPPQSVSPVSQTVSSPSPTATDPAIAPEPEADVDCTAAVTQAELNACAQAAYEAADQTLNQVYQQLQAQVDDSAAEQLIQTEQAWLTYRDANCEFERSQFEGGSIVPTVYYGCLTRMTQARTAELQQQLEQRSQ